VKDTTGSFELAFIGIAVTMVIAATVVVILEARLRGVGPTRLATE